MELTLTDLIETINAIPSDDKEMIGLFKRKLDQLVIDINAQLAQLNVGPMTLQQLIALSPKPYLKLER